MKTKTAAAILAAAIACTTLRDATHLSDMSDGEFATWQVEVAELVDLTADAVVADGLASAEDIEALAAAADLVAGGSASGILQALAVDSDAGLESLILRLAVVELVNSFKNVGGRDENGILSERARDTFAVVAARLRQ